MRVRNLPRATQEGLLQQVLEKHALVKRVEVLQDRNEAVVELENAAVSPLSMPDCLQLLTILKGSWEVVVADRAYFVQRQPSATFGRKTGWLIAVSSVCSTSQNWRNVCA